ncbi:SIR2 family protein [Arthrobacter sp. NA-172]|uniref:SIR2 family protein n=1 Tax=Arthrobacter sp. NA-172 TaxID=3367524 RepID=UPI0037545118
MQGFLGDKLSQILYREDQWNRGLITGNIAQLAVYAAMSGRPVKILTTNYDTHIENAFHDLIKRLRAETSDGIPTPNWPGLRWRTVCAPNVTEEVVEEAPPTGEAIEIVYLHGRVSKDGRADGLVVLTESDYACSLEPVLAELTASFCLPETRVLIIGSSLTDPPLVKALALTKHPSRLRVALQTLPDDLETLSARDAAPAVDLLDKRSQHLGIRMLHPLNYGQIAQFPEETSICLVHRALGAKVGSYRAKKTGVRYGQRLNYWWPQWQKRLPPDHTQSDFDTLRDVLAAAPKFLRNGKSDESFRLELWVRRDVDLERRSVTLWANSVGPIVERGFLRTELIVHNSANSSVRALMAGKPTRNHIAGLNLSSESSRWKSFLSVPIYVQVHPNLMLGGGVPVGVITLAGSGDKETGMLYQASDGHLQELIYFLIAGGRRILSIRE